MTIPDSEKQKNSHTHTFLKTSTIELIKIALDECDAVLKAQTNGCTLVSLSMAIDMLKGETE